jgi:hypothetical protein
MQNPLELMKWLYEEQGLRRFDAANRFFIILIDSNNLEESWKLKRNKDCCLIIYKPFLITIPIQIFLNTRFRLNGMTRLTIPIVLAYSLLHNKKRKRRGD